ncbi:MAG TPA: DUF2330 domain-containing protein [Gemmataceae bacterium]|nr:DUF2330 domain-containing protein [Gemmataceae bacterium]
MTPHRWLAALAFTFVFALAAMCWHEADGCASAARRGVPVAIADESAIIIWHEASKTEHFIRRASFTTDAKDFGFLVPTPTQPELGESSDEAFSSLTQILSIPKPTDKKGKAKKGSAGGGKAAPHVEVLDQKRVAGQDVVVLKATDADALGKWLTAHEYDFSASLKDWVKPYIDAKWIITASKIAKDKDGAAIKNVASAAVRMSFKTEKPFFPYSEPADQREGKTALPARLLRVFFISTDKVKGAIGEKGNHWPGKVVFADKLAPPYSSKLLHLLKLPSGETVPTTWYLTIFEDRETPRPGTADVYFGPDPDPNPKKQEPQFQDGAARPSAGFAWCLVCALILLPGLAFMARRQSR